MPTYPRYTKTDLLILRSTAPLTPTSSTSSSHPLHSFPSDPNYHVFQRAVIANQTAVFCFANYPVNPCINHLVVPHEFTSEPIFAPPINRSFFSIGSSRIVHHLRYGRSVACFNLYPSTNRDLQINHLLWSVAQTGEYDPSKGNRLLGNNVLCLALPRKFHSFLRSISREDLHTCMLQVLALIAEDEDNEGLALMRSELCPSVWKDLEAYMARTGRLDRIDGSTERGLKLMRDVEMLLRLCYLSPWKIDVYASYISPLDMHNLLVTRYPVNSYEPFPRKMLVRSTARRPVSSLTGSTSTDGRSRVMANSKTLVFWKLFLDWRRYRKVLVSGLGIHATTVAKVMLQSIANGTQNSAWEKAELVIAAACVEGNMFSKLPLDVVVSTIAPYVLLESSKPQPRSRELRGGNDSS